MLQPRLERDCKGRKKYDVIEGERREGGGYVMEQRVGGNRRGGLSDASTDKRPVIETECLVYGKQKVDFFNPEMRSLVMETRPIPPNCHQGQQNS